MRSRELEAGEPGKLGKLSKPGNQARLARVVTMLGLVGAAACRSSTTAPAPSGPPSAPVGALGAPSVVSSTTTLAPRDGAEASDAGTAAEARGEEGEPRDGAAMASEPDAGAPPRTEQDGMLLVPGGTFTMGAETGGEADERPAHAVTVGSFWLDRTEVTQSAYEACVAAGACKAADTTALDTFQGLFRAANKPIVGVSWFDARDYCQWKGKRLPREAEFERAVRGDDRRRFPWGNDTPTHERTVFETNNPEEVGTHPTGKGPYGHDDLAGNVWEWIDDDYDPFAYVRATAAEGKPGTCDEIIAAQNKLRAEGKQGFTGSNPIPSECEKAIRGGAYNYPAGGLRSTNRVHHPGRFRLRMTGFRCAKDAG